MNLRSTTAVSSRADVIFDAANGFFVPRLSRDESIPAIAKIAGATWTPIHTVKGQEQRLTEQIAELGIATYLPRVVPRGGVRLSAPMFPAVVFAALCPESKRVVEKEMLVTDITDTSVPDAAERIFADLIFMTMAEQICRYYPFVYAAAVPRPKRGAEVEMPLRINGMGDCRIISDLRDESTRLYFNFATTGTILKFELTLIQFRSLLLSKFLSESSNCA